MQAQVVALPLRPHASSPSGGLDDFGPGLVDGDRILGDSRRYRRAVIRQAARKRQRMRLGADPLERGSGDTA